MTTPSGGNHPGQRRTNSTWLGVAGAAESIEERLTALRAKGHVIWTQVDFHTGMRTLDVDGRKYCGATLADCLAAAGLA